MAEITIPFGELKSQFRSIEKEIRAAINDVLESSWYIFGRNCRAFEEEFAAYVGARHAVGVGSGTEAIHLALRAIGVGPGDEVITAANTCVPTAAGISASGASIVLVDPDPDTLTLDPSKLDAAITDRTRAIVPVHLYGHPCDMDGILAVATRRGVAVIEDCAQAHGTKYRGKRCGAFGTAAAFSFYPSKNLGACGDAGAVTTNDDSVAARVRSLRNYGEEKRYHHAVKGFNSRLDELQAAVLRAQLPRLPAWNERRRVIARAYSEALRRAPVAVPEKFGEDYVAHLYVIRTPRRDELRAALMARGIVAEVHYPVPDHRQEPARLLVALPVTEQLSREVLTLPCFPELSDAEVEMVSRAVREFFES